MSRDKIPTQGGERPMPNAGPEQGLRGIFQPSQQTQVMRMGHPAPQTGGVLQPPNYGKGSELGPHGQIPGTAPASIPLAKLAPGQPEPTHWQQDPLPPVWPPQGGMKPNRPVDALRQVFSGGNPAGNPGMGGRV